MALKFAPPKASFDAMPVRTLQELLKLQYESADFYELPFFYELDYENYTRDFVFYDTMLAPFPSGSSLLEFGAGSGRLLLRNLFRGYQCSGVEPSLPMLNTLRSKANTHSLNTANLSLYCQDAEGFIESPAAQRHAPFEAVILGFNTVQHIHLEEALLKVFRYSKQNMARGGTLLMDFTAPCYQDMSLGIREWGRPFEHHDQEGRTWVTYDHASYDETSDVLTTRFRFVANDAVKGKELRITQRMWRPQEIDFLLRCAGLKNVHFFEHDAETKAGWGCSHFFVQAF